MTDVATINEFVEAGRAALAAKDPENEVTVLVQGAAWTRVHGIALSGGGTAVELVLDEEGTSRALIAVSALIGVRYIPVHTATVGFR
jgi:hypothetical protein